MAFYSLVMYAGNGSNRNFTIHFPYLDKSHVKVKIANANTTAFSWLTDSSIQFNTAPAAGANIEIYRATPLNASPVDFTDGSILLERDLDLLTTFNLYVDQEITDRAALAISMGSGGSSNTQGLGDTAAAEAARDAAIKAAAAEAARDAAIKAARDAEAARDAALKAAAGAGGGGGGAPSGAVKASSVTVKGSPNSYVDVQTSADTPSNTCGVRYLKSGGSVGYQSYYTPSDGIFRYTSDDGGEWRWSFRSMIGDGPPAMSFKRIVGGLEYDYFALTVGDPTGSSRGMGGALDIYGTTTNNRYARINLCNDKELRGGLLAADTEMKLYGINQITLTNRNEEPFFEARRDSATVSYSTNRNNRFHWMPDGNVVLSRNSYEVWSINNYLTSDVRLKTDIKPLEGSSLEKVKQLTAKTYLWKDDLMGKGDKREIGLIAQEVAEVVPEVVSKMSSGGDTLGVAYTQLVPLLVEAVKELSAKVESLEAQLMSKE